MKPSVCVWAFLLLNSTRKYIKTSGPYQPVSFTSQKPEQCIKWQKILQLNKTLNFFCFFRAWLFSDPLSAKHGAPSLCAIAVCTNKTSCKTGDPPGTAFRRHSDRNRQWRCLAVVTHISHHCHPQPLQQKWSRGDVHTMEPLWQKPDHFSVSQVERQGMRLSQNSSATALPLLLSTIKPLMQLSSLQNGEGPTFCFL